MARRKAQQKVQKLRPLQAELLEQRCLLNGVGFELGVRYDAADLCREHDNFHLLGRSIAGADVPQQLSGSSKRLDIRFAFGYSPG